MKPHIRQSGIKGYLFGFISSLFLTVVAYCLVVWQVMPKLPLILVTCALGLIQTVIQLIFFLYLGKEEKPRHNLVIFLFMALVLAIIIGGTMWIMYTLDWRTMPFMHMWSSQ